MRKAPLSLQKQGSEETPHSKNAENAENADTETRKMRKTGFNVMALGDPHKLRVFFPSRGTRENLILSDTAKSFKGQKGAVLGAEGLFGLTRA